MSTHASIAMQHESGKVTQVYVHYDGYPSYTGNMLLKHYTDPTVVAKLVSLGGMSQLDTLVEPALDQEHSYENPAKGVTVFYARDRGESLSLAKYDSLDDYLILGVFHEYNYVFTNEGKWALIVKRKLVDLDSVCNQTDID